MSSYRADAAHTYPISLAYVCPTGRQELRVLNSKTYDFMSSYRAAAAHTCPISLAYVCPTGREELLSRGADIGGC